MTKIIIKIMIIQIMTVIIVMVITHNYGTNGPMMMITITKVNIKPTKIINIYTNDNDKIYNGDDANDKHKSG